MIQSDDPRLRLIFALDVSEDFAGVMAWVRRLKGQVGVFKIGKELFTRFGPPIVEAVRKEGAEVFLDLKFHDIPSTVARACEGAVGLGVHMFNIHALGGEEMIKEAVVATSRQAEALHVKAPLVLAVTVLTSLTDKDLTQVGFNLSVPELVTKLVTIAKKAGVHGVVCSPREIEVVRKVTGENFVLVTPGVRGQGEIRGDDQKRTLSAREAIAAGADYIVVGRPIRMAADPVAMAEALVEEIARGWEERKPCQPSTA